MRDALATGIHRLLPSEICPPRPDDDPFALIARHLEPSIEQPGPNMTDLVPFVAFIALADVGAQRPAVGGYGDVLRDLYDQPTAVQLPSVVLPRFVSIGACRDVPGLASIGFLPLAPHARDLPSALLQTFQDGGLPSLLSVAGQLDPSQLIEQASAFACGARVGSGVSLLLVPLPHFAFGPHANSHP